MALQLAQLAFEHGVLQVSVHQQKSLSRDGREQIKDVVDIETATPTAKAFLDALMTAPFFNPEEYAITVRQPRSIVSRQQPPKLTRPLVEPTIDIFQELWQFSHVTFGFVGRVLAAALLLAYGMIEDKILFIIAGLLFLQLLPSMLAVGFGVTTQQWRLVGQGAIALGTGIALLVLGGVIVALMTDPPLRFNQHNPLLTSFLISAVIGIAAGLATGDDAGRREMIGLAAAAQIAILPVWFGISFVFGFSQTGSPSERGISLVVNIATVVVAAVITYALIGMRGETLNPHIRRRS
jgi:hypothetical protein